MLVAGAARAALDSHVGLPCPLRNLTGVPCPLCGMTTSVTSTMRGDIVDAVAANPAGPAAVMVALALLVVIPRRTSLDVPRWVLPAALAAMWVWEVVRLNF
jgi:hypothetical protein